MPEDLKPQKPPGRPRARRPTAPAQVTWRKRRIFMICQGFFSMEQSPGLRFQHVSSIFSSNFHPFSVFHPCGFDNARLVASGRRVPPEVPRPERRRASPRARNGVARPDVPCATLPHMDGIGMGNIHMTKIYQDHIYSIYCIYIYMFIYLFIYSFIYLYLDSRMDNFLVHYGFYP